MKQAIHFLVMALIGLSSWANAEAKESANTRDIENSSKNITRNYNVYGFDGIVSDVVGNIVFTQSTDDKSSLKIVGPEEYVSLIKVEVDKGLLCIKQNMRMKNNKINDKITITISAPHLKLVTIEGVGGFTIIDAFKTDILNLSSKGVGNININNINCNEVNISSEGVGSVSINGNTNLAVFKLDGVGSIKAEDLKAKEVIAQSNGIGNITCYALEQVTATSNGVGSINYKGNPTIKNLSRNGIGSIKNK